MQVAADAKGVQIEGSVDQSIGTIYGDGGRLQQIAWNLLSNAVKFTPAGRPRPAGLRRSQNIAELTVTDTGVGIPAEFLPYVFEPFQPGRRLDPTRPYGGLGLGLSIVRQLVEAHGGSISVSQ